MHHLTGRMVYITAFVSPVVEHWLEWKRTQWVHHEGLIWWSIASWADDIMELLLDPRFNESKILFAIKDLDMLKCISSAGRWTCQIPDTTTNRKEGRHILFNNGLHKVYLYLYGVIHMVKNHSHIEKGILLLPLHGLLFLISTKGSVISTTSQTG